MGLRNAIFGEFRWSPPGWLVRFGAGRLLISLAVGALVVLAAVWGYRYYDALPKPPRVVAEAVPPGITPLADDKLTPLPLVLNFIQQKDPRDTTLVTRSIAALDLVEQEITQGISISPEVPGSWRWQTENQLRRLAGGRTLYRHLYGVPLRS